MTSYDLGSASHESKTFYKSYVVCGALFNALSDCPSFVGACDAVLLLSCLSPGFSIRAFKVLLSASHRLRTLVRIATHPINLNDSKNQ